jgi:TonB family protein
MAPTSLSNDSFTPREVARAAGVAEAQVVALAGADVRYIGHADAVRIGRMLAQRAAGVPVLSADRLPIFSLFASGTAARRAGVPLAVSSTLHAALVAALVFLASFNLAPRAAALRIDPANDPMRLVFLNIPGPGGGGGGGGLREPEPAPKAELEGHETVSSPIPVRRAPAHVISMPPPQRPRPLEAELLPAVVAPIVAAPADTRTRAGVTQDAPAATESRGPGQGGGAGTGTGTGLGEGNSSGIGPGSGGGTGGGPYRPGSGIEAPRLLREVKADYSEDARRQNLSGDVVMEIVVRADGSVGDVKILQGLGGGLNDRAAQAVRQWRFAPATLHGGPVDVIVEVAVEFKLR